MSRNRLIPAGLGLLGLLVVACPSGGVLENKASFEPGFCDAPKLVFDVSCSGSRCHENENGSPPDGGLELFEAGLEARVLAASASYPDLEGEGCPEEPEPIVNVENVDDSLMIKKLRGTQSCGDPMPPIGGALEETDILCVRRWLVSIIYSGAGGANGAAGGTQ